MEREKRVIALGLFDGVHLGHGALLQLASRRAKEKGLRLAAVTFDTGTQNMPGKGNAPLITSTLERSELMKRLYGVEDVLIEPFDQHLRHMDWREYVTQVLVKKYQAAHLIAGYDFHFGYRGAGDQERLCLLCIEKNIGCDIVPQIRMNGIPISSTYIRSLLVDGEMEQAMTFLGHPYCLIDQVRHGDGLGSKLGFPTLNLRIPDGCVQPPYGVYVAQVWIENHVYPAVANFGVCPTVKNGADATVEGFLLDFQGNLYGQTVCMEFLKFLRPECQFPKLENMQEQIQNDIQDTRSYFA